MKGNSPEFERQEIFETALGDAPLNGNTRRGAYLYLSLISDSSMPWSARKVCRSTRFEREFRLDLKAILRERPFEDALKGGYAYLGTPEGVEGILKVWPDGRRQLVTFDLQGEHWIADLPPYSGRGAYFFKPRLGRLPKAADGLDGSSKGTLAKVRGS
ncbi:hypothetical protein [Caballeronia sp. AZ7_KS35]|uniref:hypothetical protein n=1 Tax=Caballeronia sp. AZ7_KS35 TaxID=2921762 RepID=UPI002029667D|nr:hypothetical protein [Caballeronia sp. AZ7_KS35]